VLDMLGFVPVLRSRRFVRLLATGTIPEHFEFRFTKSTRIAYTGVATKEASRADSPAPAGLES
jgi:hypothetical protein